MFVAPDARDRAHGGADDRGRYDRADRSRSGARDFTLDAPGDGATSFAIEGARPNPTSGERMSVAFTLPSSVPARLELIDVSGRRVTEAAISSLGAGRHTVDLAGARPLAPGLYLVRLSQGPQVRVARVAVVR